jgi:hypothetical protein
MFIADTANKQSPREGILKWRNAVRSPAPSGRAFHRLFGVHGFARRCGPDDGRPASRPDRSSLAGLGIRPELGAAGRRELGFFGDHAGGHAADIGNLGAAQPERIASAGLLLFGGVGLTGGGRDRNRECGSQQPSKPEIPCSKNRHPPSPKFGGIVGERTRIRKHGWTARHSTSVAVARGWQFSGVKAGTVGSDCSFGATAMSRHPERAAVLGIRRKAAR